MALQTFILQPSADIHLLLDPAAFTTLQLQAKAFDDATGSSIITSNCDYTIANTTIATVSTAGLLTAKKEGITFLTVKHKTAAFELIARVWVHPKLDKLFLGNNSGNVHLDTDDFQPTVYADLRPGEMQDVTGHPYIKYTSLAPTTFSVDASTGRVKGLAIGNGQLRITNAITNTVVGEIKIVVIPKINAPRQIAERVTVKGFGPEKRNILFLAEGFKLGEKEKFKKIVNSIDYRMRVNPYHEPYKLLTDDYNTWLAFEPSEETGITIGNLLHFDDNVDFEFAITNVKPTTATNYSLTKLVSIVGIPIGDQKTGSYTLTQAIADWTPISGFDKNKLESKIFDAWRNSLVSVRIKAKDTVHGLMYGQRLGDRYALKPGKIKADNSWYNDWNVATDFIYKDYRRMSSDQFPSDVYNSTTNMTRHWTRTFFEYVASLKVDKGIPNTDPRFNIGNAWDFNGTDQGFVIFIVNDEVDAANTFDGPYCFGSVAIGQNDVILNASITGDTGLQVEEHNPSVSKYFIEPISATVLHELSHSVGLGDEYESIRGNPKTLSSTSGTDIDFLELNLNLNSVERIKAHGSKWESGVFRIEKSSALIKDALPGTAANTLVIELFPNEEKKWKVGEDVALVTKNLNIEAQFGAYPKTRQHAFKTAIGQIDSISATTKKIVIKNINPAGSTGFPRGSMLFFPKVFNSSLLTILLPGVVDLFNNGKGVFPGTVIHKIDETKILAQKTDCSIVNDKLSPTPASIPKVNMPSKKHELLAMYTGGGTYNCGVVRPTPVCKMRTSYFHGAGHVRFCHLCKYFIVHEFNPSKHADLDKDYPGSPV